MKIFLQIFTQSIIPIFILAGLGYYSGKKNNLNIHTLSKLVLNNYLPAFIFVNLYTIEFNAEMLKVCVYVIIFLVMNTIISSIVIKMRKYDNAMGNAFKNSILFYNAGNISIPLVMLVFSSSPFIKNGQTPYLDTAVAVQIIIYITQMMMMNTIGFFNAGRANMHWKDSVRKILSMPAIYAIPLALIMKYIPYDLTKAFIWPAVMHIKQGFVALILMTLGVQLSRTKIHMGDREVGLATAIRLLGGPMVTLLLIYIMKFDGVVAQTILISSAAPTAVNTALMAIEFDNCSDFASKAVMMSTLFSGVILTMIIFMARILFPVM